MRQREISLPYSEAKPSEVTDVYWIYAKRERGKYSKSTRRSGKWLVFVDTKDVDEVWAKIRKATEEGKLGDSAKVATAKPTPLATPVGNVKIPYFMILDKGAEREAKKLDKILKPEDNLFLLKKGSTEDYYSPDKLIEAIRSEYELEVSEEEKKKILESPRDKNIEEFLRSKGKNTTGWKIILGRRVAEVISEDEIDEEIKRIVERIATKLRVSLR